MKGKARARSAADARPRLRVPAQPWELLSLTANCDLTRSTIISAPLHYGHDGTRKGNSVGSKAVGAA